jgi:hypothetical protein
MAPMMSPRGLEPRGHLGEPERKLWADLVSSFDFADPASLTILASAMDAHQRAKECREQIAVMGLTTLDEKGTVRANPLLPAEQHSRAQYFAAMRLLHLDVIVK